MREHSLVKCHWQFLVVYPQYSQSLTGISGILSSLMLPSPALPSGYWYSVLEHKLIVYLPSIPWLWNLSLLPDDRSFRRKTYFRSGSFLTCGDVHAVKTEKLECLMWAWQVMITHVKSQSLDLKWRFTIVGLMHLEGTFQSRCVTIIKVHELISRRY
jgi:hypothetical protein